MTYKKFATGNHDDGLSGQKRILGVRLVGGTDDATAILYDDLLESGASHDFCKLVTDFGIPISTDKQMFGRNGIFLERGLSIAITGTAPILYVYYE